jgi:hypothetical protein
VVNANANISGNANIGGMLCVTGNTILSNTYITNGNVIVFSGTNIILDATTGNGVRFGTLTSSETGSENAAIGNSALKSITSGSYNTAIGSSALNSLTTGSYNVAIGYNANVANSSNSRATAIGYLAIARQDDHIAIGTASQSATICSDIAPASGYKLTISGAIQATSYNATSDRRLKSNIQILSNQSKTILEVMPVTFDWKVDGRHDIGFIAQDVYKAYPELLPKHLSSPDINVDEPVDQSGNPIYHAMDYGRMTPFLWQGMREILQRIDALESENHILKSRIEILESRI